MVSEINKIYIVAVVGIVGSLTTIGINEYFRRKYMMCEFMWKYKVDAYGSILKNLYGLHLVAHMSMRHWERLEGADDEYVRGYLMGDLNVIEGFVVGEFPELRGEFERARGYMRQSADIGFLRKNLHDLMRRVGTLSWGRLEGFISELKLLMGREFTIGTELKKGIGWWSEVEASPAEFDVETVRSYWHDLIGTVEDSMVKDLRETLQV